MPTPICVVGTIATDPRFSRTGSRAALCSFRIASHDRRFDREQGQWVDGEVNWLTVSAFRGLAEHAHASFSKGDRIIVSGRLKIRKWEAGEQTGTTVEVEAEALGHDLRWGVSSFSKRLQQQASDATTVDPERGEGAGTSASFAEARDLDANAVQQAQGVEASDVQSSPEGAGVRPVTPTSDSAFDREESRDGFVPSAA